MLFGVPYLFLIDMCANFCYKVCIDYFKSVAWQSLGTPCVKTPNCGHFFTILTPKTHVFKSIVWWKVVVNTMFLAFGALKGDTQFDLTYD